MSEYTLTNEQKEKARELRSIMGKTLTDFLIQDKPLDYKVDGLLNYINELNTHVMDYYVSILSRIADGTLTRDEFHDICRAHRIDAVQEDAPFEYDKIDYTFIAEVVGKQKV